MGSGALGLSVPEGQALKRGAPVPRISVMQIGGSAATTAAG